MITKTEYKEYNEDNYHILVQQIMEFIDFVKQNEWINSEHHTLVDIIIEFARKNNIELELIGDAISSDVYFKKFIEKDCELNKIFKSDLVHHDW